MERFPEMTSKVTALARAAGMEDPGRVAGAIIVGDGTRYVIDLSADEVSGSIPSRLGLC